MWYIIGIGANIGNTLANMNKAIEYIQAFANISQIANLYSSNALLKDNAPENWDIKYLNSAIKITTNLEPLELLAKLKEIEQKIGRNLNAQVWSPRVIDLDILAYEKGSFKTANLEIPHKELLNRSFALRPLYDIYSNWQHPTQPELDIYQHLQTLEPIGKLNQRLAKTMRMGICNLSKESFSDGNLSDNERQTNFYELINNGAEIIDIGAESTKPNTKEISTKEEFTKLDKFLINIKKQITQLKYRPLISIDTRKYQVMADILAKHSDIIWMINDVECNDIQDKAKLIAKYNKAYVITHNMGIIGRDSYLNFATAIDDICDFFITKRNALLNAGVKQDNIYFDVGFGFGKKANVAKLILDNLEKIQQKTGLKSLVGHSRKASVLGLDKTASISELDIATKKLSKELEKRNIDIVRIHKI